MNLIVAQPPTAKIFVLGFPPKMGNLYALLSPYKKLENYKIEPPATTSRVMLSPDNKLHSETEKRSLPLRYARFLTYAAGISFLAAGLGMGLSLWHPGPITGLIFPLGLVGIWLVGKASKRNF